MRYHGAALKSIFPGSLKLEAMCKHGRSKTLLHVYPFSIAFVHSGMFNYPPNDKEWYGSC